MALQTLVDTLHPKSLLHCFLAMVVLAIAMQVYALPKRSMVTLEAANSRTLLPHIPDMQTDAIPGAEDYVYSFSLYMSGSGLEQTAYSISPSPCVTGLHVNRIPVPIRIGNCDWRPGAYWNVYKPPLYVELAPYLKKGRNIITVESHRGEFDMGPIILHGYGYLSTWLGLGMIVLACFMLVLVTERVTGEHFTGYILSAGFLVYLNRLSHTGVSQYSMDQPGHLDYIAYIANHWNIPPPFAGYYFHPPLYYAISAMIENSADMLRAPDPFTCLQLFSLGCFVTFAIFSVLTLRKLLTQPLAYYITAILLVFYPSGIMFSARVDSNLLYYAAYSAFIYCTLCWLQRDNDTKFVRNFCLGLFIFALAMASRKNSLILFPILFMAFLYYSLRWGWPAGMLKRPWVRAGIVALCVGLALSIGREALYYNHVPLHRLPHVLKMEPARLDTLFIPNLPLYLDYPLWNIWSDENGRQYFWNSVLASSLFGEFQWTQQLWLASAMSYLLLAIIVYIIDGYIVHYRFLRQYPEWWMCLITLIIPLAALMEFRMIYAYVCAQDFRYIYPSLISFCGLFGLVLQRHIQEWRPFRKGLGIALVAAFTLCSVKFYWL